MSKSGHTVFEHDKCLKPNKPVRVCSGYLCAVDHNEAESKPLCYAEHDRQLTTPPSFSVAAVDGNVRNKPCCQAMTEYSPQSPVAVVNDKEESQHLCRLTMKVHCHDYFQTPGSWSYLKGHSTLCCALRNMIHKTRQQNRMDMLCHKALSPRIPQLLFMIAGVNR